MGGRATVHGLVRFGVRDVRQAANWAPASLDLFLSPAPGKLRTPQAGLLLRIRICWEVGFLVSWWN